MIVGGGRAFEALLAEEARANRKAQDIELKKLSEDGVTSHFTPEFEFEFPPDLGVTINHDAHARISEEVSIMTSSKAVDAIIL